MDILQINFMPVSLVPTIKKEMIDFWFISTIPIPLKVIVTESVKLGTTVELVVYILNSL